MDGPGIAFGLGFGIGFFGGFGWGWNHWGYEWHHGGRVSYNHNTYISHSRTIVNRKASIRREETSTVRPMLVSVAPVHTHREERIPARLAVSAMAGLRETIPSEGNPVLEAFTAGGSVAEVSTVAGAGDSSYTRGSSYKGDNTMTRSAIVPFAILMWAADSPEWLLAQESAQPTFPSAAEASQSLFQAVRSNDAQGIEKILGGSSELASSQDDAQDKADRERFVQKYQEMHRLCREADGSAGGDPVLSDGSYFRSLATNSPGKFALIAYPAEYRSSGVMTFLVTSKDVVYEKDLGANTSAAASVMAEFHKDTTWRVADQ